MIRNFFLRLLLLLAATSVFAQGVPSKPSPVRLVNDFAGLFTIEQRRALEDSLVAFDRATSTQIAVVTLTDIGSYAPSEMAFRIMDSWGVGQKDKNNGVVILLKPRNEYGRGEVFIATGLGLEGVLPDGKATRVIDRHMMPYLKDGRYFDAVWVGAQAVRDIVRGEYSADAKDDSLGGWAIIILVIGFVLFFVFVSWLSKGKGGKDGNNGSGNGGDAADAILKGILLGSLLRGGGRGSSGGGFGGGGFGGFGGGGSFGGGGGRSF